MPFLLLPYILFGWWLCSSAGTSLTRNQPQGWQRKLTQLNVATFPWDPRPDPTPAPAAAPAPAPGPMSAPSAPYTQAQLSPPSDTLSLPGMPQPAPPQVKQEPGLVKTEPGIKTEPDSQNSAMPPRHPNFSAGSAKDRAAQQLQSQFGNRAQASIDLLKQNQAAAQAGHPHQHFNPEQYRQAMAAQAASQQQHAQQNGGVNGLGASQLDGSADDFEGVLMRRDADGNPVELGRVEIDSMLHEKIAASAKRMEGGGLMLPLRQAAKHTSHPAKKTSAAASGLDGLYDDDAEAEDDDAINSDLDDPEDDQDEEEDDDETMGHIMLCMYDKVQRVKNKW